MNKTFLINFEAQVNLSGMLQLDAGTEEEAIRLATEMIKRNLNIENCLFELGTENNNEDIITVREMKLNKPANITDILPVK